MGLISAPPRSATRAGSRGPGPLRPRAARLLPALAVASLVMNIVIVGTGGAVRLTASGLGCPTWPQCGAGSYVPRAEYGIHGAVEFGNRLLTFVLVAVVAATLVAAVLARRARPGTTVLAALLFAGIPLQAVIGGISVLTHLNPWVVTAHFAVSGLLVVVATVLVLRTRSGPDPADPAGLNRSRVWAVPPPVQALGWLLGVVVAAVVYVGTVVTGSGPHAGAVGARRTGLDPAAVSQLHADLVMLVLGLTIGLVVALRSVPGSPAARAAGWLLVIEAAQALIGAVQYATGLPVVLVNLHVVGAAGVIAVAAWALWSLRSPAD